MRTQRYTRRAILNTATREHDPLHVVRLLNNHVLRLHSQSPDIFTRGALVSMRDPFLDPFNHIFVKTHSNTFVALPWQGRAIFALFPSRAIKGQGTLLGQQRPLRAYKGVPNYLGAPCPTTNCSQHSHWPAACAWKCSCSLLGQ